MLDFGEELTFQSFRIPWLIWIQLILLLFLLALFFLLSLDDDSPTSSLTSTSSSSASISASAPAAAHLHKSLPNNRSPSSTAITNRLQNTGGVESLSIKGEIETSGSTRIVREEIAEGEASPLYFLHPCHYFKLARVAFLKCLGLDYSSESDAPPNPKKHMKRKES